jgi:quinolinate synthase
VIVLAGVHFMAETAAAQSGQDRADPDLEAAARRSITAADVRLLRGKLSSVRS